MACRSATRHRRARLRFAVALLIGVGAAAALAVVIQRGLVHPMAARSVVAVSIMTIGVDVVVQTEIVRRFGAVEALSMGDPWGGSVVHAFGLTVPHTRIAALAVGLVVITAFFAWFRLSTWGVAMRAVAEDPETAALMGIRRSRVAAVAWLLAGALAAIAGLFLSVSPAAGPHPGGHASWRCTPSPPRSSADSTPPPARSLGGLVVGVAEMLDPGVRRRPRVPRPRLPRRHAVRRDGGGAADPPVRSVRHSGVASCLIRVPS